MPIVSQQEVSVEIDSITFSYDGTLDVTVRKTYSGDAGSATTMRFHLDVTTTNTILDVPSLQGYTMRQSLVILVYQYLIANGVDGTIA